MKRKRLIAVGLPIAIVAAALLISLVVFSLSPKAAKSKPTPTSPVVEVATLKQKSVQVRVPATGVVAAEQEVTLIPQVEGKVVDVSRSLKPGGRVRKGELLVRIDARDYQLAVEQQRSQVRASELELELEQGRGAVARSAWKILGEGTSAKEAPLAVRSSQLEAAESAVTASQSALEQAKLALSRTRLVAPFDALVLDEEVDVGQVVGRQTALATLVGTQAMRVRVSIPVEDLEWLSLGGSGACADSRPAKTPGNAKAVAGGGPAEENGGPAEENGGPAEEKRAAKEKQSAGREAECTDAEQPTKAIVRQKLRESVIEREGYVAGLVGQLDPATRRAQLLVMVDDPLRDDSKLPLLPGAYVDVTIFGSLLAGVYAIPRRAWVEGNHVWVVGKSRELSKRKMRVRWADAEMQYASGTIAPDEQLVLTPPSSAVEGMRVRIADD